MATLSSYPRSHLTNSMHTAGAYTGWVDTREGRCRVCAVGGNAEKPLEGTEGNRIRSEAISQRRIRECGKPSCVRRSCPRSRPQKRTSRDRLKTEADQTQIWDERGKLAFSTVFRKNAEKLQRPTLVPHGEVGQRPPVDTATVESCSRPIHTLALTQGRWVCPGPTVLFRHLSTEKTKPTSSSPSPHEPAPQFHIWLLSHTENASAAAQLFSLTSAWLRRHHACCFLRLLGCLPLIWLLLGRASWTWGPLWTQRNA